MTRHQTIFFSNPFFLAALFLGLGTRFGYAQNYNFKIYGAEDGLPQAQIQTLFQDRDGYLWVGTYSGAARYNGRTWQVFTSEDGLARNEVMAINQDKRGRILFGTRGGGLSIYNHSTFQNFESNTLPGNSQVEQILVDTKSRIWMATLQGLIVVDGRDIRAFGPGNGLPDLACHAIFERHDQTLWVGTKQGIARFDGSGFQVPPEQQNKKLGEVTTLTESKSSQLFIGTKKGLFTLNQTMEIEPFRKDPINLQSFRKSKRDHLGHLWFSTEDSGVFQIDNGDVKEITTANGLAHNIVYDIMADRENNLWFGTDDGLNKLSEGPFTTFNKDHGLADNFVATIFESKDNQLWMGGRSGVSVLEEGLFVEKIDSNKLTHLTVHSIAEHPKTGQFLFGTAHGLTAVDIDNQVYTRYLHGANFPLDEVRSVFVDSKDRIWLGGFQGLVLWEGKTFTKLNHGKQIGNAQVLKVVEDNKGDLWVATRNLGLLRVSGDDLTVTHFQDYFADAVWTVASDPKGGVWIGTNGLGLYHYAFGEFTSYHKKDGLADTFIWQIVCATNGDVWVGHNKGLDRLREGEFTNYNSSDGLADNEGVASACLEDRHQNLWFGSGKGVTKYDSGTQSSTPPPPLAHLEKIEILQNGSYHEIGKGLIALPPRHNSLRFTFAGISFRNEKHLRYSYKLTGIDQDWREPTSDNFAPYNNLDKGNYTFHVKALSMGQYSEPASFQFTILPTFWETWWFRMFIIMTLLASTGGYHWARLLRIKKRTRILEDLVNERTKELARKNKELKELSLCDSLTKLRNRRYLTETIPVEITKLRRILYKQDANVQEYKYYLGFMMIDIDHFKSINDTYGHDAGDIVLVNLARIIQEVVRHSDIVVRWGGEEFLIFLKDLKKGMLSNMAHRVIDAVRKADHDIGAGKTIKRTCSIGYAYYPGHTEADQIHWEDIVKLADKALYIAKTTGRDQTIGLGLNPQLSGRELSTSLSRDLQEGIDQGVFKKIELDD